MKKTLLALAIFLGGAIALTMSPLLNAASATIQTPYTLDLKLFNVSGPLSQTTWLGSEIELILQDPFKPDGVNNIAGTLRTVASGTPWQPRAINGTLDGATRRVDFNTVLAGVPTLFRGSFTPDWLQASGRLDGYNPSNMAGQWTATSTVPLPSSALLFLGALAVTATVVRRRS